MDLPNNIQIAAFLFSSITLFVALVQIHVNNDQIAKKKKEIEQRAYESLILREIGERIGYELNIAKILDTIIDSLDRLLPFSVVSYMLISADASSVLEKVHLEESVNRAFLEQVKKHTLDSVNEVSPKVFRPEEIKESLTGSAIDEGNHGAIGSIWITPLTINSRGIGALAVASKKTNLYKGPEMQILTQLLQQANRAVNNLESVIASEQRKIDAMVLSMADGVLMFDRDFNLSVINPTAAKLLSLNPDRKATIFDVVRNLSDRIDLRSKIEESFTNDQLVTVEDLLLGEKVSQVLISPVKDRNQKIVGSVVIFHDVTAQKELDRLRDNFTAMMVHELRAPLTVVRGTADIVARNPNLATEEKGQQLLKTMETSADTMLSLVNDLLDVAKIESGKFQIVKTKNSVSEVIKDRVNFFQTFAEEKSLQMEMQLPETDINCDFDRERISQVLNNLISNAVKFTSIGGKITVSAQMVNSQSEINWRFTPNVPPEVSKSVVFTVADTGVGIAEDKVGTLFSKFQQIQPGRMGSGLGLVIAKGIVESHDGKIFVESRPNEGTSVHFTIPLS